MTRFSEHGSRALPAEGDRVLVAGLGASGVAAARACAALGATVTVADDRDDRRTREAAAASGAAAMLLGGIDASLVAGNDLVVVSPGVPAHAPVHAAAAAAGVPVWSEIELGWRLADVPVLGVTGTNGKTTTTEMLAACLTAGGIEAIAAGNIGLPLTEAAAERRADAIVCEASSFQLHSIVSFHAPVSVLLNLADDHLDWHGTFDAYASAKSRLFENQRDRDVAVVYDDEICRKTAQTAGRVVPFAAGRVPDGGAGVRDGRIVVPEGEVLAASALQGSGGAFVADAVAAAAAAAAFGVRLEAIADALARFEPAAHRMEPVATIDGVRYVNDSKATNPHATLAALEGLADVVLIAGGKNKDLDLSPLAASPAVKSVVAIGEAAERIERAFAEAGVPVARAGSMREAVRVAATKARPGQVVLLSPACASFDMFRDYRERGEAFRSAVAEVAGGGSDE